MAFSGDTTISALEATSEYQRTGVEIMNRGVEGKCLDFGTWDYEAKVEGREGIMSKISGPAWVNEECHGDQWQRFKFDGEKIVGAFHEYYSRPGSQTLSGATFDAHPADTSKMS